MATPAVDVSVATSTQRPLLARLLQLALHDLSSYPPARDVDIEGRFSYEYFDLYWQEEARSPLVFHSDGAPVGFALVRLGQPNEVAEFFVLNRYRKQGIGRAAAQALFGMYPGEWLVHELNKNDAAVAFWRSVIPVPFTETTDEHGTAQRFELQS